jgi:phosphoglycolate phosphatase
LYRGLIFDVDGTLVSLKVDREKLHAATMSELRQMGFDVSRLEGNYRYTQDALDWAQKEVEAGNVDVGFETVKRNMNVALDRLELDWNAQAEPIPGTTEVLAALRSSSVRLATLTNSGRAPSDWLLRKHGLQSYFDFTLSRDDVGAMKPRSDGMLKAISMMGLPAGDLLYVGDSVIDVLAAKGAGLKVASVVTGRYTAERLRGEGTDYILDSLAGVLELV